MSTEARGNDPLPPTAHPGRPEALSPCSAAELRPLALEFGYRGARAVIEQCCEQVGGDAGDRWDTTALEDPDDRGLVDRAVRLLELRRLIRRGREHYHVIEILDDRKDDSYVVP